MKRRYDADTITSDGIYRACPRLADCKEVKFDANSLCGVCPTCPDEPTDDACGRGTIRKV